jgi:small subunit ribosomal protein S17e
VSVQVSAIEHDIIEVDPDTKEMLKVLDFGNIPGLQVVQQPQQATTQFTRSGGR